MGPWAHGSLSFLKSLETVLLLPGARVWVYIALGMYFYPVCASGGFMSVLPVWITVSVTESVGLWRGAVVPLRVPPCTHGLPTLLSPGGGGLPLFILLLTCSGGMAGWGVSVSGCVFLGECLSLSEGRIFAGGPASLAMFVRVCVGAHVSPREFSCTLVFQGLCLM